MPEYVLLMYSPAEGGARKADGTVITDPEDFKAEHQRWMQYDQDLKAAGCSSTTGAWPESKPPPR